ncbi:SH3-domain-containing protein [Russula ochroleuca]|uniref:SH3-domain-containing protein n=1 Tax=Russula ochroleuca TaxID=152965 RepID=A0A9P5N3I0_9AGAM|nr:SH3-domain-containing protein [Russula ochroleuca]
MPFANLPTHEKDAFFALLDEYFTTRPDLLSRVGGAGTPGAAGAAITAAAQRAVTANPAAASRLLAAGINRANNSSSGSTTAAGSNNGHTPPAVNVGRVAAAAHAFSAVAPPPSKAASPPMAHKAPDVNKLVPQKKFGDVDVSSAGAMFRSLRGSTAAKNAPPPTMYTPPAFAGKKASSSFAPPPMRRVSASTPPSIAPAPEPEEDAQPEWAVEEEAGEWTEALYDYTSEEAGDLPLQAGERVRVTEKTSPEWWTGEVDGRSGLFPASYVKPL